MAKWRMIAILATVLLTGACLPVTSKAPVGINTPDPGLAGSWKAVIADDNTPAWFHFLPQDDGSLTVLMVAGITENDDGSWMQFKIQTAKLGDTRYINAVQISEDGEAVTGRAATDNVPLLYRYRDVRTVALYLIDEKMAAEAVRRGKISGTVKNGDNGDVRLTAAESEQNQFFQSTDGAALFTTPWAVLMKMD